MTSVRFELPYLLISSQAHNHYTRSNISKCKMKTQKSLQYPSVMVDWFQLNSDNSPNLMDVIQNRKKNMSTCRIQHESVAHIKIREGREITDEISH